MTLGGLSEAEKAVLLHSLTAVGPDKTVGYLPLHTLAHFAQIDPDEVIQRAADRGLASACFGPNECCIKSGALYVYDPEALGKLLRTNTDILAATGIPAEPAAFVTYIAANWLEPTHPLYPIVAEAFGTNA